MGHASKNRIKINNSGQVLMESAALLPVIVGFTTMILVCTYLVLARKWADYWVYRAALCQAASLNTSLCRRELNRKLEQLLPHSIYQMETSWITRTESHVAIKIKIGKRFELPIRSTVNMDL